MNSPSHCALAAFSSFVLSVCAGSWPMVLLGCSRSTSAPSESNGTRVTSTASSRGSTVPGLATSERATAGLRIPESPRRTDPTKARELPSYVVTPLRRGEPIVIDGQLDEPAWTSAKRSDDFVHPGTGEPVGADAALGGSMRLRYDQESLYVAIDARDIDVRGGFAPDAVDPRLWTRDTVEIMLDPDGDGDNRDYYEIQIGPQGLVFDSQFDSYNSPRVLPDGPFGHQDFDSKTRRAVRVDGTLDDSSDRDRGYVVEAAVPWKRLTKARRVPPRPGDEWRANFYVMKDNAGVSWSPILGQGNFHKASQFGRLRFSD